MTDWGGRGRQILLNSRLTWSTHKLLGQSENRVRPFFQKKKRKERELER